MKLKRLLIMLIIFMAAAMSAEGHRDDVPSSDAAPHLQLDSAYLDIGTVYCDSVGEGVMRFRNSGTEPLQIMKIFSECGCTVPAYSEEDVMPGEAGEIRIRFDARGRRPGPFRKALRIRSNADNAREILVVKGKVAALTPLNE